jgi:hypothetical protein
MHHVRRTAALAFVAVSLLAPALQAQSGQAPDELAEKLVKLRAEVEELSEQLTTQKVEARNELSSLARQKSDLEVELDREQVRVAKLRDSLSKSKEKVKEVSAVGEDLAPIYDAALAGMRAYVERSLPFRRAERLAELDKIDEQRRTGLLTHPRALTRLWSFIEDELRMTRESALFQQTITLDGREQLANVVRVGMVAMYFQTEDGAVGHTQPSSEGWRFVRVSATEERKLVRALFDNFRKQIRVGLFVVPNALPEVQK